MNILKSIRNTEGIPVYWLGEDEPVQNLKYAGNEALKHSKNLNTGIKFKASKHIILECSRIGTLSV